MAAGRGRRADDDLIWLGLLALLLWLLFQREGGPWGVVPRSRARGGFHEAGPTGGGDGGGGGPDGGDGGDGGLLAAPASVGPAGFPDDGDGVAVASSDPLSSPLSPDSSRGGPTAGSPLELEASPSLLLVAPAPARRPSGRGGPTEFNASDFAAEPVAPGGTRSRASSGRPSLSASALSRGGDDGGGGEAPPGLLDRILDAVFTVPDRNTNIPGGVRPGRPVILPVPIPVGAPAVSASSVLDVALGVGQRAPSFLTPAQVAAAGGNVGRAASSAANAGVVRAGEAVGRLGDEAAVAILAAGGAVAALADRALNRDTVEAPPVQGPQLVPSNVPPVLLAPSPPPAPFTSDAAGRAAYAASQSAQGPSLPPPPAPAHAPPSPVNVPSPAPPSSPPPAAVLRRLERLE